jgi:hypothetical protein
MDLIETQRSAVAQHIRREAEQKWSEVPLTPVQDERAFYDFVPVGHFSGSEGVRQLYHTMGSAFQISTSTFRLNTMSRAAPFARA